MQDIEYINRKTGELIRERPPGLKYLKFLYHSPLGYLSLHSVVKRKFFSALYGWLMNRPNSVKKIKTYVDQLNIDMNEAIKSVSEFSSFNDFFTRKLKPKARSIEEGVVSPADSKLLAFESLREISTFYVKGEKFTLQNFLRDKDLAEKYKNSSMLIFRLAPNDYHRFHFPYSGIASNSKKIKGGYFSVSPYAVLPNFAKVFCENKRELLELKTEDKGDILIIPVGATMVGKIFTTYASNSQVQKGQETGYFAFGGSTVVVLIDQDRITIDPDLLKNTRNNMETAVKMGEQVAS